VCVVSRNRDVATAVLPPTDDHVSGTLGHCKLDLHELQGVHKTCTIDGQPQK
jgi:hypothetical protein